MSSAQPPAHLLTAEQVAERLAVSERYVWRLGREGELPRVRMGKYVRFAAEDVDAFIAQRRECSPEGGARVEPMSSQRGASSRRTSKAGARRRFR